MTDTQKNFEGDRHMPMMRRSDFAWLVNPGGKRRGSIKSFPRSNERVEDVE